MATVFTHPVVALALVSPLRELPHWKLMLFAGGLLTIFPDIDVISFRLGIPYENVWGHRGMTHSIFFAALASLATVFLFTRQWDKQFVVLWAYFFACMASHGVLDAMTNGGLGVAFFAPFSDARYFMPIQPIEVSTLDLRRFMSSHGMNVLKSELIWIWTPVAVIYILLKLFKFTIRSR
jgi:inner membrane protein